MVFVLKILPIVTLFFLLFGCGKKNLNGGSGDIGFTINIDLSTSNNKTSPGFNFDPVKIKVTDPDGRAISNAKLEFSTFRLSSKGALEEIPKTEIIIQAQNAWKNSWNYLDREGDTSLQSDQEADLKGAIFEPPRQTDSSGLAEVTVVAPRAFNAEILLVARVVDDDFQGYGYTILATEEVGSGAESLRFVTSGGNLETAGEEFEIFVQLIRKNSDGTAKVISSFNDIATVKVLSDINREWWPANDFPEEKVYSCQFSGGQCQLSGGPWIMNQAGEYSVQVLDPTGEKFIAEDSSFIVVENKPDLVLLSSTDPKVKYTPLCTGLDDPTSLTFPCMTLSADDKNKLFYPVIADKGWNYLAQSEAVINTTGVLSGKITNGSSPTTKVFNPETTGTGSLQILDMENALEYNMSYQVKHGAPTTYSLATESNNTEVATNAFKVVVTLKDEFGNIASTYSGTETASIQLLDATSSPWSVAPVTSLTESLSFSNGVAITTGTLKATNSNDTPKVKITGVLGTNESDPLTITPGVTTSVVLETIDGGQRTQLIAQDILSTATLAIFASGRDSYGNRNDDEIVDFSVSGALTGTLTIATNDATTLNPQKNNPVTLGTGTLTATPTNPLLGPVTSPPIDVVSALAASLKIIVNNDVAPVAGDNFTIKFQALDPEGAPALGYEGVKNLSLTSQTKNSWYGTAPTLPNGAFQCTFVDGECTLAGNYIITKSNDPILISVEDTGTEINGVFSEAVTATTGAAHAMAIADAMGGPAGNATPYSGDNADIEITADDNITLYGAIIDQAGNWISNAGTSTWSGDATVVSPYLSVTNGNSTTLNGTKAGSGTITLSESTYIAETLNVAVSHGAYDHINITTENNNTEEPGVCFQISADIEDSDNNKITSYNLVNTLTVSVINAESAPAVRLRPMINANGQNNELTWSGLTPITNGSIGFGGTICLYDATSVSPQIQIDLPAIETYSAFSDTSPVITINPGAISYLMYSPTLGGNDGTFVCDFANQGVGNSETCSSYNVDNGPVTFCAENYDLGGNWISNATGNWDSNNANIKGDMSNTLGTNCVTLGNVAAGFPWSEGSVTFTPTDGSPKSGYANFQIYPGAVTHAAVTGASAGGVIRTDEYFGLNVSLRDQHNNISGRNEVHDVSFAFKTGTTNNSPKGTAPQLFTNYSSYTFDQGQLTSPYNTGTNTGFYTPNASDDPVIEVTVSGLSMVEYTVPLNAGTAKELRILSAPSQGATNYTNNTVGLTSNNDLTVYAGTFDNEENYIGVVNSDWTLAGFGGTGTLLPAAGTYSIFDPWKVGTGTISAEPQDKSLPLVSTGTITVSSGPLNGFYVYTNSGTNTVSAGVASPVTLRAVDVGGNNILDFDGPKTINWSIFNSAANVENRSHTIPASGTYNFTDGVMTDTVNVTLYNSAASPYLRVEHTDGQLYTGNSGTQTINAGAAHHYGVVADDSVNVKSDHSVTFSATVQLRDEWGNIVSGGDTDVALTLVKSNGDPSVGTLVGTKTNINVSSGTATVNDLAYNVGGYHKLKAAGSGGYTEVLDANDTIDFVTNSETVASYNISFSSPQTAGQAFPITITALDGSGNTIVGADTELSALTFAWSGPNAAPDATTPLLPTSLTFIGGVAYPSVTLYKNETIGTGSLTIQDNQATPRSGASTTSLQINAGTLAQYKVTSPQTTRLADYTSTFDVTIEAYDNYDNPRAGDGNLTLVPVREAGVTNTGNFSGNFNAINTGSGSAVVTGLTYNVGHTISFDVTGGSANVSTSDQIAFTSTIHTVDHYAVVPAARVTAGAANTNVTVTAKDAGNNTITNIDGNLGAQSYAWSGAGTSPAPASTAPSYDTAATFTSGVGTFTHSFYDAETIAIYGLSVTDNYSGGAGPARTGTSANGITVGPAAANKYRITSGTQSVSAGTGFDLTVTAYDAYDNVDINYDGSDTLTWSWSGTSSTSTGSSSPASAQVLASASRSFTDGVFNSSSVASGAFILYNEYDANPQINLNGTSLTGSLNGWSVNNLTAVDYIIIRSGNTHASAEYTTGSITADDSLTLYAHSYDVYGNHIGLDATTDWSATGIINGRISPTTNSSSTTFTAAPIGTGTITATPAVGTVDSTGTITVTPGAAASFTVDLSVSTSIVAGTNFQTTVTAYDADGNLATGYTGSKNLTWTWNSAANSPAPTNTAPKKLANGNRTFSSGVFTSGATDFSLYADSITAATLSVSQGGVSGTSAALAVSPATKSSLTIDSLSTKTAGSAFAAQVNILDAYSNPTDIDCTTDVTVTGGNTSAGGHEGTATPPTLPGATSRTGSAPFNVTGITLFAKGSNTLTFSACGLSNNANVTVAESSVNVIYMNSSNTAPASHLTSLTCTQGTTVSCGPIYVFAWDTYGNEVDTGSYSCAAYSYTDNTVNNPDPTFNNASGHSTTLSTTSWHVDGTIRCTSDSKTADIAVTGKIEKNFGWSCGNWACATTTPSASCTVNNNTGYDASAYSFGGVANGTSYTDTTACDSGATSGNQCQVTLSGVTGNTSGNLTVTATESAPTLVEMLAPSSTPVQSGDPAPNCTNTLSQSITSDWSCSAGKGQWTATITNNNGVNSATFPNSDPTFSVANGATLVSTTCKNTSVAPGGTCSATVENPNSGQSSTLDVAPNDGFFQTVSITKGSSPNCTQDASTNVTVQTACSGGGPYSKTLRITLTNDNTIEDMTFPANAATVNDGLGTVSADTCSSQTITNSGGSCYFDITYTNNAPATNTLDVSISENGAYFNDITIGTVDGSNACP